MSAQLDLHFTRELPPFQRHSETSRQAAIKTYPRLIALEQRVLDYIRSKGGATDIEGAADLEMNPSTYRPRRISLVAYGLVCDSGHRRPGNGRVSATVWKVT